MADLMVKGLQGGVLGVVTVKVVLGLRTAVVGQRVAMVVVALTEASLRCGHI